jgi:hypothetical protein
VANSEAPRSGCLGPKSVAFWTVVAGVAAVIGLLPSGCQLPIPWFGHDDPGNSPGVSPPSQPTAELLGQWRGSGNQYPNDGYQMHIDMTLAPDGGYVTIRDGATREDGIYAIDGPYIRFQPSIGSQYEWHWTFASFGARHVLKIQNEAGGVYTLQKV